MIHTRTSITTSSPLYLSLICHFVKWQIRLSDTKAMSWSTGRTFNTYDKRSASATLITHAMKTEIMMYVINGAAGHSGYSCFSCINSRWVWQWVSPATTRKNISIKIWKQKSLNVFSPYNAEILLYASRRPTVFLFHLNTYVMGLRPV